MLEYPIRPNALVDKAMEDMVKRRLLYPSHNAQERTTGLKVKVKIGTNLITKTYIPSLSQINKHRWGGIVSLERSLSVTAFEGYLSQRTNGYQIQDFRA